MTADVPLNDRRVRIISTAAQTVFSFDFPIEAPSDLKVYTNGVEDVSGFTVDASAQTVTYSSGRAEDDIVTIEGSQEITRARAYPLRGGLDTPLLNGDARRIYRTLQELRRDTDRTVILNKADSDGVEALLPRAVAGRLIKWKDDGTGLENGAVVSGLEDLEAITDDIVTLAAVADDIPTLAALSTDIPILAALDTEIAALYAIRAGITAVANNEADVSTVADAIASVIIVAADLAGADTIGEAATFLSAYPKLAAIGALDDSDGNIIVGSAGGWTAENGAAARTSLGLGTSDDAKFNALEVNDIDLTPELDVFTPTVFGRTTPGSPVIDTAVGYYRDCGEYFDWNIYIVLSSKGGMTGALGIGGLPFGIFNNTAMQGGISIGLATNFSSGFLDGTGLYPYHFNGQSSVSIRSNNGGGTGLNNVDVSDIEDDFAIRIAGRTRKA